MIFDLVCYALAIAATLAFVGSSRPQQCPIHATLETLHAFGEALPDEVFSVDAEASIPDVDVPDYDELFAQADVIGDRLDAMEPAQDAEPVEDFADLLAISDPTSHRIDTRWLGTYGVHTMRTLGSLLDLKGARRWSKGQAIATLQAHYALA